MSISMKLNLDKFKHFYGDDAFLKMQEKAKSAHETLYTKSGKGNDFLGWLDLPEKSMKKLDEINKVAEKIKKESDVLLVIGIGGSYLGARAAIEFIKSPNYNLIDRKGCPQVFFVGNNMSPDHTLEILDLIGDRDFSVNVISKSGATTEPALAFHFFSEKLKEKYKDNWADRLYVTTDKSKGDLRKFTDKTGCTNFVLDDDIGGRFSVLSEVGLLPIACAGIDIKEVLEGALSMQNELKNFSLDNIAVEYAVARNIAYDDRKTVELLGCYEPRFRFMAEWWKQLFGESEGKDRKGIFPASADFSADLHSLGQYIQDGEKILFETIVDIENTERNILIENTNKDFERLGLFEGLDMASINKMAMMGTAKAHVSGDIPNILLSIKDSKERSYGELVYFFEAACAISAYILDVNPFDQPGVEDYKKEMIKLVTERK